MARPRQQDYDYLIKLLLIGDSGKQTTLAAAPGGLPTASPHVSLPPVRRGQVLLAFTLQ